MEDDPKAKSDDDQRAKKDGNPNPERPPALASLDFQPKKVVEITGRESSAKDAKDDNEAERQRTLERSANWQAWCAVAISFFTLLQVGVGYYQWDATRKQYDVMMSDQRPWIDIEAPTLDRKKRQITFTMVNRGKTPAYVEDVLYFAMEYHSVLQTDPDARVKLFLEKRLPWISAYETEMVVSPAGSHQFFFVAVVTDKSVIEGTSRDDVEVRFACRVVYRDTGGVRHTTEKWFTEVGNQRTMRPYGRHDKMD